MSENIFELTPMEEFQMEFERYFPDFYDALINDTLDTDTELRRRTDRMNDLAERAGIQSLGQYTIDYMNERGYKV
ncbi:MAG: hypothetical protein IJ779_01575 [Ruminococcus sp.]|nr:hypothetical protein [Ruminococcus sp.]